MVAVVVLGRQVVRGVARVAAAAEAGRRGVEVAAITDRRDSASADAGASDDSSAACILELPFTENQPG